MQRLDRRQFLALPLVSLIWGLSPGPARAAASLERTYAANVGILFNLLTFTVEGTIAEEIDRPGQRYRVTMNAEGSGVTSETRGSGIIRGGRFKPTQLESIHTVRGRENRTSLAYDYDRGLVEYHSVSYTLLLGRRRQADDVLRLSPGQQIDDLFSAELNFAADKLDRDPDGAYRVTVVRRARSASEGPDEASAQGYGAEFATLRFHAEPEKSTGQLAAWMDLTGFSSWARSSQPARVWFTPDRHLESIDSSMILGTRFTLRINRRA